MQIEDGRLDFSEAELLIVQWILFYGIGYVAKLIAEARKQGKVSLYHPATADQIDALVAASLGTQIPSTEPPIPETPGA